LGSQGEQAVAEWYEARGFSVVARNWRTRSGEIDLVVGKDRLIVMCEVKTRSSDRFGSPAESVTPTKIRRLRRLAAEWLSKSRASGNLASGSGGPGVSGGSSGVDLRFDVASVTVTRGNLTIDVLEGVF
jgi:uncharacterized protein (TIGR00252 family)